MAVGSVGVPATYIDYNIEVPNKFNKVLVSRYQNYNLILVYHESTIPEVHVFDRNTAQYTSHH